MSTASVGFHSFQERLRTATRSLTGLGVAMILLALRLPSLTQRGIDLRRRYQAFHNYLHDFGRFHDKEAEQIVLWDYYLAYNFFRMAAIVQGIRKRAELGTAAAANALEFGRGARLLAEMGWRRARLVGAG